MESTNSLIETVCFAAGQSGGHIIPCLTLAQQCKRKNPSCTVLFFSTNEALDTTITRAASCIDTGITLKIGRSRTWYLLPLRVLELLYATAKSGFYLIKQRPDRVISTGGIIAIPVCIAAWMLRIPIELYELNAVPGTSIRVLAWLATRIHVCFAQTKQWFSKTTCILSAYPIRFETEQKPIQPLDQFEPNRFTLFVQGGSQGSHAINTQIKKLVAACPELHNRLQIIHQTGSDNSTNWQQFYAQHHIPAHTFGYDHNIAPYYHMANLVICRSGAGALFEAVFFQKPCITIPLETQTNNHQLHNARAIAAEYPHLFFLARQHEDIISLIRKRIMMESGN